MGGKKPISSFFFPPSHPRSPWSPSTPKRFVFGSVSCFRAICFRFLGLSCSVVVLQTHCDLKASVPVPATIQEGGRGPTAGMLGQKVTAQAQRHKGGDIDRWWGVWGRAAPFAWPRQPGPFSPEVVPQPHSAAMLEGGVSRHVPVFLPQHETTSHSPKRPRKQAFEVQLNGQQPAFRVLVH